MLINVGLNDLDNNDPSTVTAKFENLINVIKKKIPSATIFINSLIFRKDNRYNNETIEINEYLEEFASDNKKVIYIHNKNISNKEHMYDQKHLNRAGFYNFITNMKYALFGFLPNFNQAPRKRSEETNKRHNNYNNYNKYNNNYHRNRDGKYKHDRRGDYEEYDAYNYN